MGLLRLPLRGLFWIAEEVAARAENALYDEEGLRAELVALYRELEEGRVTEEDFARREEALAERLAEAEAHRAEVGP
jgi:gas vesicle protein GvpG